MIKVKCLCKERLSDKCNGLSSSTKFWESFDGRTTREYHEHPETGELVVMDTWYVSAGEDDVDHEFEVIAVESPTICEISKKVVEIENKIKNL